MKSSTLSILSLILGLVVFVLAFLVLDHFNPPTISKSPVETEVRRFTNDLTIHIFEGHEYINYFGGTIMHSESCPCRNRTIHFTPSDVIQLTK